jgi:hypothetical protein
MATDVSAPLPDLSWPDQAIISVALGNAGGKITGLRIHLSQDVPEELLTVPPFVPLFTYGNAP